jgi:hypothetical protein
MSESWWDELLNMYSRRGDEELSVEEIDETLERIEAETTSHWGKPTPKCQACLQETRRHLQNGLCIGCMKMFAELKVRWRPMAIHFDTLVKEMRNLAGPGRVTTVSYSGLKFAVDCGIDVWDYAETLSLAAVIRDHGTPEQKLRLQQEIFAGRRSTELYFEAQQRRNSVEMNREDRPATMDGAVQ